jgi:AraC-like DNA-binding protein
MKLKLEEIRPGENSSFRLLLTPMLQDLFYWHFHPEYEIVYIEAESGTRHIGDHISVFKESDLVLIGPNIPHLNFDYGIQTACEQVVVQMREDFLGKEGLSIPELSAIQQLFQKARRGIAFHGATKQKAGEQLKQLSDLNNFDQLLLLLQIFQQLALSNECTVLNTEPLTNIRLQKEKERLQVIYKYLEENFQQRVDVNEVAALAHLSTPAFCRYFKKNTGITFTDFVNQFRISQSKKILLQNKSVTDACYESGFENLSYFNKTFKKLAGENPSRFRKRHLATIVGGEMTSLNLR